MNNIKQYIFPNNGFIYLIIFIISKVVLFFFLDIKLSPINYGYHLLDISLLQNDLIQSLKYLHSQPLLWNFFNGLVVKFFDGNLNSITIFFTLYHYFLTWFIFCLSNLLLNQFHKNKVQWRFDDNGSGKATWNYPWKPHCLARTHIVIPRYERPGFQGTRSYAGRHWRCVAGTHLPASR